MNVSNQVQPGISPFIKKESMINQFIYREYSSIKRRLDRFLRKTKKLRVVHMEDDTTNKKMVYLLSLRWSWFNISMLNKVVKLTLEEVDGSVTRIELSILYKGEQLKGANTSKITDRLLENLTYHF